MTDGIEQHNPVQSIDSQHVFRGEVFLSRSGEIAFRVYENDELFAAGSGFSDVDEAVDACSSAAFDAVMPIAVSPQARARGWLSGCCFLDTETTGLGADAEIVEISIIDQSGTVLLDTLVKPLNPILADATAIHGITNEMVSQAPSWPSVYDCVLSVVLNRPVVIYNADYDLRMIAQSSALYGFVFPVDVVDARCAMLAYAEFWGEWDDYRNKYRWQRLGNAAAQQGVVVDGSAHRALADVLMTLGIVKAMAGFPV